MLVLEELGEARHRRAHERVEVGTAGEALTQAGELADLLTVGAQLAGHWSATCTAANTCSSSTTR